MDGDLSWLAANLLIPNIALVGSPVIFSAPFAGRKCSLPQTVELELGAGDGSFLVQYASAHPQVNFFAVERLLGRVRKMDRKSHKAGCGNIRLLRVEASYLLNHLIPEASLQAIHLYFPDPWPRRNIIKTGW